MSKNNPKCDVHMYPKKKSKYNFFVFVTIIFGGVVCFHSSLDTNIDIGET